MDRHSRSPIRILVHVLSPFLHTHSPHIRLAGRADASIIPPVHGLPLTHITHRNAHPTRTRFCIHTRFCIPQQFDSRTYFAAVAISNLLSCS